MKYIEKTLEDDNTGAVVGYHEITAINCDYANNSVVATLSSYVSKKAKDRGKNALSFAQFTFTSSMPSRDESAHNWVLDQLILPEPEGFQPETYYGYVNPHMFAGGTIKQS
ncbi:hypothetical protein [Glaesserella sp.]|uniref:hypothetical protein n=1 Tax=Glaesserella sp. TaxID=2094731 RepID=UPI0035A0CE05